MAEVKKSMRVPMVLLDLRYRTPLKTNRALKRRTLIFSLLHSFKSTEQGAFDASGGKLDFPSLRTWKYHNIPPKFPDFTYSLCAGFSVV